MQVIINSPEATQFAYTAYSGKVLKAEIIHSSQQGGVFKSPINGERSYLPSALATRRAKVALPSGRIKEFDTNIEMQEGDEVEFIIASNGDKIYVKNTTSGDWDIAEPVYQRSETTVPLVGFMCILVVTFGVYSLFKTKSFMLGLACVSVGIGVIILMMRYRQTVVGKLKAEYEAKVEATGIKVPAFKAVKQS